MWMKQEMLHECHYVHIVTFLEEASAPTHKAIKKKFVFLANQLVFPNMVTWMVST